MIKKWFLIVFILSACKCFPQQKLVTDVLVVGGGTGGTAAAIQAARSGVSVILAEPGPWLGGMLSAAGVSAIDGNHRLPSGIWAEFRDRIYQVYGGPEKVSTGWVSNTQFEPHVADSILKSMCAAEKNLRVFHGLHFQSAILKSNRLTGALFTDHDKTFRVEAKVVIDATEMGDVMASAKIPYDLGMEAGSLTGEKVGVTRSVNIVQDLTYVATLKDYGPAADCTIVKPMGYNPSEFDGACSDYFTNTKAKKPTSNAWQMLDYGRLPNNKYLINWPIKGNDTYLNLVEMPESRRQQELEKAKQKTLRFIYFIQHQLGFKNLGLASDEYPTSDRLALMPYYREGRRLQGLVRFTINHIADPYGNGQPLYRTGIAVGDYPIDHHHKENPEAPQHLDFYPVPSFNLPLGTLIPKTGEGLIVAEKGISVSNVVNGTTRLQPCVLLTGQAAGILAATAVKERLSIREVPVRKVQQQLLSARAYIMPYIDVQPTDTGFAEIQKIGATGILRGKGIPYQWANQTWFYPDSLVLASAFKTGWKEFSKYPVDTKGEYLLTHEALQLIAGYLKSFPVLQNQLEHGQSAEQYMQSHWSGWGLKNFDAQRPLTRRELSVLLDRMIDPFRRPIDIIGRFR